MPLVESKLDKKTPPQSLTSLAPLSAHIYVLLYVPVDGVYSVKHKPRTAGEQREPEATKDGAHRGMSRLDAVDEIVLENR